MPASGPADEKEPGSARINSPTRRTRPMLGVSPQRDELEPMSQLPDVEMIFAFSPPVAERRGRLTRSRRLAGVAAAVAAVVGAAALMVLLLLH